MRRSALRFSLPVLFLLALLLLFLGGCASRTKPVPDQPPDTGAAPVEVSPTDSDAFALEEEFAEDEAQETFDPLSGYNRMMTQVNDRVYFWALKPVAQGYRAVVPEPARLGVGRFFKNLMMPVRCVNNLLQLKPKRAGTELARFTINSTFGVLGFMDVAASHAGLKEAYPEDFGQTLGHYGVGGGFHVVLPLLGPSNLRDLVGRVPDHFLNPITYVEGADARLAIQAYDRVNHTSLHIGEYESLKKDAVDLYPFLRDSYEQYRRGQIKE